MCQNRLSPGARALVIGSRRFSDPPMPKQPPIKPHIIALICVLAVAILFVGSIVIGVAVIQAEHAVPAQPNDQ
jgi:hypothetical protein